MRRTRTVTTTSAHPGGGGPRSRSGGRTGCSKQRNRPHPLDHGPVGGGVVVWGAFEDGDRLLVTSKVTQRSVAVGVAPLLAAGCGDLGVGAVVDGLAHLAGGGHCTGWQVGGHASIS